jgi:hypothetical protein
MLVEQAQKAGAKLKVAILVCSSSSSPRHNRLELRTLLRRFRLVVLRAIL